MKRFGQLGAHAAVEHPIPRPRDGIGAGEGAHVDRGAGERDPHRGPVGNRIHEQPPVLDRAGTASERDGGLRVDAHAVVGDCDRARRVDHEGDGDRFGRVVRDLDDHDGGIAVTNRVHALDRRAAGDAHRRVCHGRRVRSRPVHRPVATGYEPERAIGSHGDQAYHHEAENR